MRRSLIFYTEGKKHRLEDKNKGEVNETKEEKEILESFWKRRTGATEPETYFFIIRSMSLLSSFVLRASRLSYSFFPLPTPSSIFTFPFLK